MGDADLEVRQRPVPTSRTRLLLASTIVVDFIAWQCRSPRDRTRFRERFQRGRGDRAAFRCRAGGGDSAAALALLADDVLVLESGGVETRDQYQPAAYRGRHRGRPNDAEPADPSPRAYAVRWPGCL